MRTSDVERRCLHVEGTEFRIETRGSGSDCFILVPGIGMSPRYFVPLARELATTSTVHALHLPGFGAARRPVQALPIQETGRLATQALRQLDVGRFIVVGHSMGCLTGVEMALADPAADVVAVEKGKIKGAIRTDFVLSAEIIVITLGVVAAAAFVAQVIRCPRSSSTVAIARANTRRRFPAFTPGTTGTRISRRA